MGSHLKHHRKLNAEGIGKCGVPAWRGGMPAGFCDAEAYGEYVDGRQAVWNEGHRKMMDPYRPGLACPEHGGPTKEEARAARGEETQP